MAFCSMLSATLDSGAFCGQGFINAFSDYQTMSYNAGSDIAKSATNGLGDAMSKVQDIIDNDIDSQPTIRPVLDLSAVEAGAGRIGNMFGMSPSIGLMSNVNSISSSMNKNQNGANADVISAIKELSNKLSDTSGDTYNINGITYDGGSDVAQAIEVLVRAARVGERV